ncbi:MAG: aspartate aminotransferase family protein [Proteobacteria bacterium]|nr:aspartate aminotransferase family protein [Pseudomonadota bacterium]MDA0952812.1 aspartate aminotransferase family protein [Pseudomonadota bacterium]
MPTYGRADLVFARGEGAYLFTETGERYLDFGCGIAVTSLGHAHPHLVAALKDQAERLWHTSNLYRISGQERLAERLVANSFADSVFFANSGAEANEGALKMARRYQWANGHPERYRTIAFNGAFHGRTLATISAGSAAKHLEGFGPPVEGFDHIPLHDSNALRQAITAETAAIIVEPVQGEGGITPVDPQFLKAIRAAADEFGLIVIYDEVQCGMGRSGKLFAHEWAGVAPDVMSVAKALGGGMPIGAILASERVASAMTAGSHGSTFGGNPLATAVGNAVLDVMLEPGFLPGVEAKAKALRKGLDDLARKHPEMILEIRGLGMMIGVKVAPPVGEVVQALRDRKLLTVPAGDNMVRLLPPLIVEQAQIDEGLAALDAVMAEMTP